MEYSLAGIGPLLNVVVAVFMVVAALVGLGLVVVMAALPGQLAKRRQHPQATAINVCGWVGLPTGILWAVAMVWAFLKPQTLAATNSTDLVAQIDLLERSIAKLESRGNVTA